MKSLNPCLKRYQNIISAEVSSVQFEYAHPLSSLAYLYHIPITIQQEFGCKVVELSQADIYQNLLKMNISKTFL